MAMRSTIFKGLTYNIRVEEFHDQDAAGHLNGYVASIYVETASTRHLIRRSRLPGAAATDMPYSANWSKSGLGLTRHGH